MFSMLRLFFALALLSPAAFAADTILVFGDSLSAGYGIPRDQSWPSLLARKLQAEKLPYDLANASVSGETTAGGRSRFASALERFKPAIVVFELGANDGLRGLPVDQMRANLQDMVRSAQGRGARVLLVGMRLPPNYGGDYSTNFEKAFRDIAQRQKTAYLPFLLEPIALDSSAFQPDGLHPTAQAQPKILDHIWNALRPLLR